MKISFCGLDLPEGKIKYKDEIVEGLTAKFDPKKTSPWFAELIRENLSLADAIAVHRDRVLDVLISDMEKMEVRLARGCPAEEEVLVKRCLAFLEEEKPLCDLSIDDSEMPLMKTLAPISRKPVLICDEQVPELNELITAVLDRADMTFFYTAGKQEVHAWPVRKDTDIVTCAGQIHSDLARGFIRAEIIRWEDLKNLHNLQEARDKGFARLVDRDYRICHGDIIEVRFSV